MKGWDPEGQTGPRKPLPDSVTISEPPPDKIVLEPTSEQREPVVPVTIPAEDPFATQEGGYQQEPYAEQPVF
jgi:small subunit ribosomal protein S3e